MALAGVIKSVAERLGFVVLHRSTAEEIADEYPWLAPRVGMPLQRAPHAPPAAVPSGAPSTSDPRLADLRKRYEGHPATAHTVWARQHLETELGTLGRFREDNGYVWQTRVSNPIQYLLAAYYAKDHDPLGLYPRLEEDGAFGAHTFQHDGRALSRDMLDSIMEISFLEEQIGLSRIPDLSVLDIGAGYGRLAYRMTEALPNLARYLCADAVAESTYVSAFYAAYRGIDDTVDVVPLDEIEDVVSTTRIDVAVNIHSFSECPLAAIEFWLDLVRRARVPWLFIVPNTGGELVSSEADQSRAPFLASITSRGYELVTSRDKYHLSSATQRYGLFPGTYFLFRRRD